jgi:hypothetical protein
MADVKGDNKTIQDAVTPGTLLAPEVIGGKERVIYDIYTLAASASGTVIYLPELPEGAMVTDWIIDHAALGSSVTLKFGTVADDDAFMVATACAAADKKNFTDDGVASSLGYRADVVTSGAEKTKPIITTAGATGTGAIKVMIKYVAKA